MRPCGGPGSTGHWQPSESPRSARPCVTSRPIPTRPGTPPNSAPRSPLAGVTARPNGPRPKNGSGLSFHHHTGAEVGRLIPPVTSSGGVALFDFDGDGWLDVYAVQGGPFPPRPGAPFGDRLFRNRGDGTFEDATERSGLAHLAG